MNVDGYKFDRDALALLLIRTHYPERTDRESAIIRDWLTVRGAQYDQFAFSVRIGTPATTDPEHLEGVQRSAAYSSLKRIDVLAWEGDQPTIVEVKERVTPSCLGQVLTYRDLFLRQYPEARVPKLLVIGRYSDDDTIRSLNGAGVDVLLYEAGAAA